MTTLTRNDLSALGYEVRDGKAVKVTSSNDKSGIGRPTQDTRATGNAGSTPVVAGPRYRSKWEAERAEWWEAHMREGFIKSWRYEPLRLRLADGTYYKPDFLVEFVSSGGPEIMLEEVKGFWREAAKVRYKVARELFPMFTFNAVTKRNGQWVSAL